MWLNSFAIRTGCGSCSAMARILSVCSYEFKNGLFDRNVQWFRGGLILKAYRQVYHSTPGSRVITQKILLGCCRAMMAALGSTSMCVRTRVQGVHCRANMAHVRQSRPDSGLGFQVEVLQSFLVVPSSLCSRLQDS